VTNDVRQASLDDAPALAALMADAFDNDPVSQWIFPDAEQRRAAHPSFFGAFVEQVIAEGLALTTTDLAGVTLWLTVDPAAHADPAEAEQLHQHMRDAIGDGPAERFAILDATMNRQHPSTEIHAYLPFIAIAPDRQGQGIGRRLLSHRLEQLDADGTPAYLEASNLRNAALYKRLGFDHLSPTLDMPGGPSLYPMWRPPTAR